VILHGNFLTVATLARGMLHSMQQPEQNDSSTSPNFAGLLAALTSPAPKYGDGSSPHEKDSAPAWNDDALADDIATLSYERTLRTHASYEAAAPGDWSLTQQVAAPEPIPSSNALSPEAVPNQPGATPSASSWSEDTEPEISLSSTLEQNRKCASVTIRMSKAECAQLHKRAAEAGLTISAYLRSCTFEAETLRAQVKETLAQLRAGGSAETQAAPSTSHRARFDWLVRHLQHTQTPQQMARA
jgi:hypothetical protein